MKTYENNMADQDVVVHSLKVLSNLKNPALSQLQRDLNVQQTTSQALAKRQETFYKSLSDDGIINPLEKKILQREMESIAQSYTALYQQAVAEHYEQAPFFQDYMATYAALYAYIYNSLHLFDNMEEDTEVDREQFNEFFSDYYFSENTAIVSMTVGVITELNFKVLTSLEDEGIEGQVGIYHGSLYQYTDGEWQIINRELYYGKSETLPPAEEGRYFLCAKDGILSDVLYVNDEPLEVNGEVLEIGNSYEKGVIYVYENNHWDAKDPAEDYRYLVAMGDYYSIKEVLPPVMKTEIEHVARLAAGSTYYGPLIVPPVEPHEGDFFLYVGATSTQVIDHKWIKYELYKYHNGDWEWLDATVFQNRDYFMQALQDILTEAPATTGYFSTAFCNAFFANSASINALSTKVIYLDTGGALRSRETQYTYHTQGLLIDASGNIDANGNTHIGGTCTIDGTTTIGGTTTIQGICNVDKLHFRRSYNPGDTGFVNGDMWMVNI